MSNIIFKTKAGHSFSNLPSDIINASMSNGVIIFSAQQEHPEVCAIEAVYAECLRLCNIETPNTHFFNLPNGLTAFASKRFDRQNGMRIPM